MSRNPKRELERVAMEVAKLPTYLTNRSFDLQLRKVTDVDPNELENYYGGRLQQIRREAARRLGCDRCDTMAGCKAGDDDRCKVRPE